MRSCGLSSIEFAHTHARTQHNGVFVCSGGGVGAASRPNSRACNQVALSRQQTRLRDCAHTMRLQRQHTDSIIIIIREVDGVFSSHRFGVNYVRVGWCWRWLVCGIGMSSKKKTPDAVHCRAESKSVCACAPNKTEQIIQSHPAQSTPLSSAHNSPEVDFSLTHIVFGCF